MQVRGYYMIHYDTQQLLTVNGKKNMRLFDKPDDFHGEISWGEIIGNCVLGPTPASPTFDYPRCSMVLEYLPTFG